MSKATWFNSPMNTEAPRFSAVIAARKFAINMLFGLAIVCGLLVGGYATENVASGTNQDCFDYSTGAFVQCQR